MSGIFNCLRIKYVLIRCHSYFTGCLFLFFQFFTQYRAYIIQAFQLYNKRFTIINPNHLNLQTTPKSVCESLYKFLVAIIFLRFHFWRLCHHHLFTEICTVYVFQRRILDRSTTAATDFEDCHYINPLRRCG